MIYLDNAATTIIKPENVYSSVNDALRHFGNPGRSGGEASLRAGRCIFNARQELTAFFGGDDSSRMVFTANATESLNIAIKGLAKSGDHIVTTLTEHNSVLRPLYQMEEAGCELSFADTDNNGTIDIESIENSIRSNTRMIVCNHASNVTGNVTDIEAIGKIARKHNLLFLVDASQTAGFIQIDVKKMNIDMLAFTGHKALMGPQGIGGLYVGESIDIRPLLSGGTGVQSFLKSQPDALPEHLEAGTLNSPGIAGLLAAVRFINDKGITDIHNHESELARIFYSEIQDIDNVKLYGDYRDFRRRCPIVSLNIGDLDSGETGDILEREYGIATRTGIHCAPLIHKHMGTQEQGAVRFSFSYFNTEEEAVKAANAVREIAKSVR